MDPEPARNRDSAADSDPRGAEVVADLDDTPPSNMDLLFYMQTYVELHMHLEELLAAVDEVGRTNGNGSDGSR